MRLPRPRAPILLVLLCAGSLSAPRPVGAAGPPSSLLVFVTRGEGEVGVHERLSFERVKAGLEASLSPLPTRVLGLSRAEPVASVEGALRRLDEGEEAWLSSSFDDSEGAYRDGLAWALGHLPAVALQADVEPRLLAAGVRLVQLARLAGREPADDPLLLRALAWWGNGPLSEDDFPPSVCAEVRALAANASGCRGEVAWQVLGAPAPGGALALGGRVVTGEGGREPLPCGTWPVRWIAPGGTPSPWEWRLDVRGGEPSSVAVNVRFEGALTLVGERSLEVREYPGLADDLRRLAGGVAFQLLELAPGPDGVATARAVPDLRSPGSLAGPPVVARTPEGSGAWRFAPWALYGLAVASLAAGITLNVVTNGWIREQNEGRGSAFERIDQGRAGALGCYGVAGATALAGGIWHALTW